MLVPLHTLPDWRQFGRVAVDIETRDPNLRKLGPGPRRAQEEGGFIAGVAFACDGGPSHYLPMRHSGGGNYDADTVMAYLRHQAGQYRGEIAGANLQYDLDWLEQDGVVFRPSFFRDVQISAPLLEEPKAYGPPTSMSLEAVAKRAGLPGKFEDELEAWAKSRKLDPKADMWQAPAHVVAKYAVQDVLLPLEILKRHEREIDEQGLRAVYNLESRLLPALLAMRRRGVRVDLDQVQKIKLEAVTRRGGACDELSKLSGHRITSDNLNSSAALAEALKADGVKCPRTPSGGPSVTAPWLRGLDTPVARAIMEAKRWDKIQGTFCESILKHSVNGRIHCTFNQLRSETEAGDTKGAEFGRLSCTNPNLQQQPSRDPEIGPLWRSIYLPDEGGQWACLDFSSQEPRLITHYADLLASDDGLKMRPEVRAAAKAAAHACRTDPDWDNHSMMAGFIWPEYTHAAYKAGDKAAKLMRGQAKEIFLGRCYGMGGGKLCRGLGLPTVHMVLERTGGEWTWHPTDSIRGRELLAEGHQAYERAGPEGQELLDKFNAGVPYVNMLNYMVKKKAASRGYITTLLDRRCRFPRLSNGEYDWLHKGLNRLVQGGAADQTKLAMVLAHEEGVPMQLQVHDELDLTVEDLPEALRLKEIMEHAIELRVPTRCDVEMGPSWGEIKVVA